jgi:hypothetical protein
MGAIAKNPIPQLMPAAAQPLSSIFLNDSSAPMRIMGLNEARQLSQFVPVIVLVAASSTEDASPPSKTARNNSPGATTATSKLVEFFSKAATPAKIKSTESDFVFGGVKVNFTSMEASRKGEPVMLTALEFKTLKYFVQNVRRVVSRDELLNEVWDHSLIQFGAVSWPFVRSLESTMPISTRRLAARACSLSPGTRGSDLPKPLVVMIFGEIPACTRKSWTASARRWDSCRLYVCVPISSVYP